MDQLVGFLSGGSQLDGELNLPKVLGDLGTKTITENGVYVASDDDLDGYKRVIVDVPEDVVEITISDCTFTDADSNGNIVITEVA